MKEEYLPYLFKYVFGEVPRDRNMPEKTELRTLHPFFYRRALAYALVTLCIGVSLTLFPQRFDTQAAYAFIREIIPGSAWGLIFIASSISLLWTMHFSPYRVMRLMFVLSVIWYTMWAIGLLFAWAVGMGVSLHSSALYFFIAFIGHSLATDPLTPRIVPRSENEHS